MVVLFTTFLWFAFKGTDAVIWNLLASFTSNFIQSFPMDVLWSVYQSIILDDQLLQRPVSANHIEDNKRGRRCSHMIVVLVN